MSAPRTPEEALAFLSRLNPSGIKLGLERVSEALEAGIVDHAVGEDDVRPTALEIAGALTGKAGDTLGTIKARMYGPALEALRAAGRA